jgi:hypothetical protein
MKILKINEEEKCIEFKNVKGSMISFNGHIKDIRDKILNNYINVVNPNVQKTK